MFQQGSDLISGWHKSYSSLSSQHDHCCKQRVFQEEKGSLSPYKTLSSVLKGGLILDHQLTVEKPLPMYSDTTQSIVSPCFVHTKLCVFAIHFYLTCIHVYLLYIYLSINYNFLHRVIWLRERPHFLFQSWSIFHSPGCLFCSHTERNVRTTPSCTFLRASYRLKIHMKNLDIHIKWQQVNTFSPLYCIVDKLWFPRLDVERKTVSWLCQHCDCQTTSRESRKSLASPRSAIFFPPKQFRLVLPYCAVIG